MADVTTLLSNFLTTLITGGQPVVVQTAAFVEDATSTTHTATIAIPAGSTLLDIMISNGAYWGATAATLDVGDTDDPNGYFAAINLKATDIVPGEVISISGSTGNWGGKNGAYLVAATGRRGPATTNFGFFYVAASNITGVVTVTTPAATTGRTWMSVLYATGKAVTPVTA